jgi:hypothetical protein
MPRVDHDFERTFAESGRWQGSAMTAQSHKTAEEEYEEQVRILVRIVSASTLGLFAFAAGLLIGTFLFS